MSHFQLFEFTLKPRPHRLMRNRQILKLTCKSRRCQLMRCLLFRQTPRQFCFRKLMAGIRTLMGNLGVSQPLNSVRDLCLR